jgi:uncharacterized integral membrane protein (TIGR00698 family)
MSNIMSRIRPLVPGIALSVVVTVAALILAEIETAIVGYAILEPLVLALLLGLVVRNVWTPPAQFQAGISFSGKQMLEFAIVLLGASLDFHSIVDAGIKLLVAITLMVTTALVVGVVIGRAAGLETRQAILIAVGNAICGNSAIAAVAPAIKATKQQIASAIALTAVFGIGVVLVLPLFKAAIEMSNERYGVFAGMTVYAVPQVLAATIPVSAVSGQFGSLTKLTRVLFLGPVVAIFAWLYRDRDVDSSTRSLSLTKLFPWFIIGFVSLMILRSVHVIPDDLGHRLQDVSKILTAIAMAALGLSVDLRSVRSTGSRVFGVVATLTGVLLVVAFALVTLLSIG